MLNLNQKEIKLKRVIFILADASLELAPEWMLKGLKVKRRILDVFWFKDKILKMPDNEKRGRPDIVHRALLLLQDSLLNKRGYLRVYIHTITGDIIEVLPETRPPRHYLRFLGLMEQLLIKGKVPPQGEPLMRVINVRLRDIINKYNPCIVIGFSRRGKRVNLLEYLSSIASMYENVVNIVGAFPKGFFSSDVTDVIDELISIAEESLSAPYVVSKIISTYEFILQL